jgi:hypothetical protein
LDIKIRRTLFEGLLLITYVLCREGGEGAIYDWYISTPNAELESAEIEQQAKFYLIKITRPMFSGTSAENKP